MFKKVFVSIMFLCLTTIISADEGAVIAQGKTVRLDYTLYVNNEVVDSTQGKEPISYVQGNNMIIKGLERQLEGLAVGAEKTIEVAAEEAYGPMDPKGIIEFPRKNLQDNVEPVVGMVLEVESKEGQKMNGTITEVKADTLVLNFNHPLAGQNLKFVVKVVDVQ